MHWATLPPLHLVPRWRIELPYPPCKDGVLTVKLPRQKTLEIFKEQTYYSRFCDCCQVVDSTRIELVSIPCQGIVLPLN